MDAEGNPERMIMTMNKTYTRPPDAVDPNAAKYHDGLSEKEFMVTLIADARANGWRVFHDLDSRRNEAGFPDILMTNGRFVYFVELKAKKGRVTKAQQKWLDDLDSSAFHAVRVWRPSDWPEFIKVIETDVREPQER